MGNTNISNLYLRPQGADQHLDVSSSVVSLAAFPSRTKYVQWQVQEADIRVTFDGADPVAASNGLILAAGDSGTWHKDQANAAQFLRRNGIDAVFWAQPCV